MDRSQPCHLYINNLQSPKNSQTKVFISRRKTVGTSFKNENLLLVVLNLIKSQKVCSIAHIQTDRFQEFLLQPIMKDRSNELWDMSTSSWIYMYIEYTFIIQICNCFNETRIVTSLLYLITSSIDKCPIVVH